jgi:hypothetical protein
MRKDMGEKVEDIALSEGVSVKAVEKSIRQITLEKAVHNQQNLNTAVISMLMGNLRHVNSAFQSGLGAKNYIEKKNADGSTELVAVDDTELQLKALQVYGKYLEAMHPKGGGVNVNVQQNNPTQINNNMRNSGYEGVLRTVLEKVNAHNQLPRETADVYEAEVEDDEEEDDEQVIEAK